MAFRDIIGQESPVRILAKTIQRGRIPSSYLFSGQSGIGKKLTAVTLAKALNCLTVQGDACDECPSCKKIDSGIHPDVLLISPESGQIRIEEIRAVDEMLSLKAFEGRYKVVMVDDADTLNQYAANAFLKTLEEPPEDSLIILVSSNPDRLPDTIRSRCSRIHFAPLSAKACAQVIEKIMRRDMPASDSPSKRDAKSRKSPQASPPAMSASQLPTLVRLSMGSPGNTAANLIEERTWCLQLLRDMLSAEKDGWASREEMDRWFDLILILLRDMAVFRITGEESHLVNMDLKDYIAHISSATDIKVIIEHYRKINTLKGYLGVNLNKSLTWNYTGSLLRTMMDVTRA